MNKGKEQTGSKDWTDIRELNPKIPQPKGIKEWVRYNFGFRCAFRNRCRHYRQNSTICNKFPDDYGYRCYEGR